MTNATIAKPLSDHEQLLHDATIQIAVDENYEAEVHAAIQHTSDPEQIVSVAICKSLALLTEEHDCTGGDCYICAVKRSVGRETALEAISAVELRATAAITTMAAAVRSMAAQLGVIHPALGESAEVGEDITPETWLARSQEAINSFAEHCQSIEAGYEIAA